MKNKNLNVKSTKVKESLKKTIYLTNIKKINIK